MKGMKKYLLDEWVGEYFQKGNQSRDWESEIACCD